MRIGFNFVNVTVADIMKIIDNLQAKTSSGVDGLSVKLLKLIKDDVASSIIIILIMAEMAVVYRGWLPH